MRLAPAAAVLVAACFPVAAQSLWFVQGSGVPSGTGSPLDPFGSIQQAILAAANGDTILVGPGTYLENLLFGGKAVTVRSSSGPVATVIQGDGTMSVVRFVNGEGPASRIEGFTITGGANTMHGGGVWTLTAGPVIARCIITGNVAYDGGGITASSNSYPQILSCTIAGNVAGAGAYAGGGVRCSSSSGATTIRDCVIYQNNSGISGNPTNVTFSDVQGGYPGTGNIAQDPLFASPTDFTLLPGSPCLGTATAGADMGALSAQDPPLALAIAQPAGPGGDLLVGNAQGQPGAFYLTFLSADPANAAAPGTGLLFGLHIAPADVLFQLASPSPLFHGALDLSGASLFVVPGAALPPSLSGILLSGVTATFAVTGPDFLEAALPASHTIL